METRGLNRLERWSSSHPIASCSFSSCSFSLPARPKVRADVEAIAAARAAASPVEASSFFASYKDSSNATPDEASKVVSKEVTVASAEASEKTVAAGPSSTFSTSSTSSADAEGVKKVNSNFVS